jgi:hypothetical protein
MLATQITRPGHWGATYALRGLSDQYCDLGYHYDVGVDNCVPDSGGGYCDNPANFAECNWTYDTTPDQTLPSDNGSPDVWASIIAAAGKIATGVVQATNTQYRTTTGMYSYGTGPYSALTPALAQQYLASRSSTFGGLSTTTWLLIGGGLLFAVMMMKR